MANYDALDVWDDGDTYGFGIGRKPIVTVSNRGDNLREHAF